MAASPSIVRETVSMTVAEVAAGEGLGCAPANTVRSCEAERGKASTKACVPQLAVMMSGTHERDDQSWLSKSFEGAYRATRPDIAGWPSGFGPNCRNSLHTKTCNRWPYMRCGFQLEVMIQRLFCDESGDSGTGQSIPRAGVRWLGAPYPIAAHSIADDRGTARLMRPLRRGATLGPLR